MIGYVKREKHFLAQVLDGKFKVINNISRATAQTLVDKYKLSQYIYIKSINDFLRLFICSSSGWVGVASNKTIECTKNLKFSDLPLGYAKELIKNDILIPIEIDEFDIIKNNYLNYVQERQMMWNHFVFCPTLECNCRCIYCYENPLEKRDGKATLGQLYGYCKFVEDHAHKHPDHMITCELFGGEPLMKENRNLIEKYFDWLKLRKLSTAITTNGMDIMEYIDILLTKKRYIYLVNVTIDGPESIHNKRRRSLNNNNAFQIIENAVDTLKYLRIPVSVSINLDAENVDYLTEVINFIENKKWVSTQGKFFFHICQVDDHLGNLHLSNRLNEGQLLAKIYPVLKRTPQNIRDITRLQFLRTLNYIAMEFGLSFRQNELGKIRYHHCWATSPTYVYYFTPDKHIYKCPYALGINKTAVGTYNTKYVNLNENKIEEWEKRAFFNIEECKKCNIAPLCGGGCFIAAQVRGLQNYCGDSFESLDAFCKHIVPQWIREKYPKIEGHKNLK